MPSHQCCLHSAVRKNGVKPKVNTQQHTQIVYTDIMDKFERIQLIQGDALQVLRQFKPGTFDAVITDPPYSSGGATISAKQAPTSSKYTGTKTHCPHADFEGDARDQRSWTSWMAEWMGLARAASKTGAPICIFSDWRQLPAATDALQWAGWYWRGTLPWDKVNARPQRGRFRQQAEFVVWGSNGPMPIDRPVPVLPGAFRMAAPAAAHRRHQTEKPVELMRELVKICVPGGRIVDPFAGSGTTLEAAWAEGYEAVGIEMVAAIAAVAQERIAALA